MPCSIGQVDHRNRLQTGGAFQQIGSNWRIIYICGGLRVSCCCCLLVLVFNRGLLLTRGDTGNLGKGKKERAGDHPRDQRPPHSLQHGY